MSNDNNMNISAIATETVMLFIDNNAKELKQALKLSSQLRPNGSRQLYVASCLRRHFEPHIFNCKSLDNILLQTIVGQIDWQELADHYIQKVNEGATV